MYYLVFLAIVGVGLISCESIDSKLIDALDKNDSHVFRASTSNEIECNSYRKIILGEKKESFFYRKYAKSIRYHGCQ